LKQKQAINKVQQSALKTSNMSSASTITLCFKYALGRVTKDDVEWVFNNLFGETLVLDVTEIVKQDRYSGKDFKMFFIKCDETNQKLDNLDRLVCKIKAKGMAKVTIDEWDHFWQVSLAIEKPKAEFKPRIVDEPTVEDLEKAMEGLQTEEHGRKRGAEEGEVIIPEDSEIAQAALGEVAKRFKTKGTA